MTPNDLDHRLHALGLTTEQIQGVMDILVEGLTVEVFVDKFSMRTESMTITNTDESGTVCGFDVQIDGINPHQIAAVAVPRIDYAEVKPFIVSVDLLPLALAKETEKLANAVFSHSETYKQE